jgi:hypothetical protein
MPHFLCNSALQFKTRKNTRKSTQKVPLCTIKCAKKHPFLAQKSRPIPAASGSLAFRPSLARHPRPRQKIAQPGGLVALRLDENAVAADVLGVAQREGEQLVAERIHF